MFRQARIDDLLHHITLGSLQAHPHGWCFGVTAIDIHADAPVSSIWNVDREGTARQLVESGHGAVWSTDGRHMAFLRSVGSGCEVFLFDPANGQSSQISHLDGALVSIEQFDSSTGSVLVRRTEALCSVDAPWAIDALPCRQEGVPLPGCQAVRLGTLELASGDYADQVREGGDVLEARWDPSMQRLAYLQRRPGRERHLIDLWVKDGDAAAEPISTRLPSISTLRWAPDGRRLAIGGSAVEGDAITHPYVVDLDATRPALRRIDIDMGAPATLQWVASGDALLTTEAVRGAQRIVLASLDGGITVLYAQEGVQVQDAAVFDGVAGFIAQAMDAGPEFWMADPAEAGPRRLTRFSTWRDQLAPLRIARRVFRVPDGDGGEDAIDGWLVLPEGGGPFPLLLDMGGQSHAPVATGFEQHAHWPVLVQHGWAVLALDAVGTCGYGGAFADRLLGRCGELDYPQWEAAARQLQDAGIATGHVAAFGHDYGGYLAAWALGQGALLHSAVISAGVVNLQSHAGNSDSGYYVVPHALAGEPSDVPERYRALSPITRAHRIKGPVLLLHGLVDQRCSVGQSEALFTALVRATDTPVRMVRFPGGGHDVGTRGTPSHRVVYFEELVRWLEKWRRADDAAPSG